MTSNKTTHEPPDYGTINMSSAVIVYFTSSFGFAVQPRALRVCIRHGARPLPLDAQAYRWHARCWVGRPRCVRRPPASLDLQALRVVLRVSDDMVGSCQGFLGDLQALEAPACLFWRPLKAFTSWHFPRPDVPMTFGLASKTKCLDQLSSLFLFLWCWWLVFEGSCGRVV